MPPGWDRADQEEDKDDEQYCSNRH
jgi:hypothetical protein